MALTEEGKRKLSQFASSRQRVAGGKFAEVESDAERLDSLYAELLPERLRGLDKTRPWVYCETFHCEGRGGRPE